MERSLTFVIQFVFILTLVLGFTGSLSELPEFVDANANQVESEWIEAFGNNPNGRRTEEPVIFVTVALIAAIIALLIMAFVIYKLFSLSKKLRLLASHDSLTGIFNRRYFLEHAPTHILRSARANNNSYIIMYDLDYFKNVNDTYGHSAGDLVLKEISEQVKSMIRPYDILSRYGGEEFLILMCDSTDDDVLRMTQRICNAIAKTPVVYKGNEIIITASFGIAKVKSPCDIHEAINNSDNALYQAKNQGRNRVVLYEESNNNNS